MKIIPHGAAREVTGSCHEIRLSTGTRILLDCGMFHGHRAEAAKKNAEVSFDAAGVSALILSHAHGDHVGRIPVLCKKGFRGPVHCTYATKDLADVMLQDSGYIQEKDEEYFCKHLRKSMMPCEGPLYTQEEAAACIKFFQGHNYGEWFDVAPGVRAQFLEAGHIIGAAMVVLEVSPLDTSRLRRDTRGDTALYIGFSGDLGRPMLPIIRDPVPMPPVEVLICESTYGNRLHDDIQTAKWALRDTIVETAKRGGKVLIPAFSLERTQEIVYDLHLLWDAREIPAIPIVIDSPLASRVTDVFMKHPECYDRELFEQFLSKAHNPFQFSLVRHTETVEDSKALNGTPGPMVIMAGSGMCEGGRIRHHLRNGIEDPRNTVLAVGYMAEHTLGRQIIDPAITQVKIFDEFYRKKAQVRSINAYSGHADMTDLDSFVTRVEGLTTLVLVHGEPDQMEPFAERIRHARPGVTVLMPKRGEEIAV